MDRKQQTGDAVGSDTMLAGSDAEPRLRGVVETEIIPRLVHAHTKPRESNASGQMIRPADIEAFARALLERSPDPAYRLLEAHRERGVPLEAIYLQLFVGAAHLLGEWWESDESNFSQVTFSMTRIHGMLNQLSPSFHAGANSTQLERSGERRILMTTMPGQQHTLGLSMLAEFFRRDGWVVLAIPAPEPGLIQASLSTNWFDLLALSASTDAEIEDLGSTILAARKTSRNPRLSIMVGGPLLGRQPHLGKALGADGVSNDAADALALAQRLLQAQKEVRLN
jgi:MerR family transcriptional regulator, light-induced transcriptional regulator